MAMNFNDVDDLFADFDYTPTEKQQPTSNVTMKKAEPAPVEITFNDATNQLELVQSGQVKINQIGVELNNAFVEREDIIKNMLLSLITNSNVLLYGAPGTAKSLLTQELCSRIEGGNYFQWMLNKTTDPSEILGPFSVKKMEEDKFMRITTGKLPEAHVAFLDECYKSNSPCLNALLTIMNEHIFYNDGKPVPIPLMTVIGASNELPEDDTLAALHDRFLFRMKVNYVNDASNKKRMHSNYINTRSGRLHSTGKTTITIDELKALNNAAKNVNVSKDIVNTFIRLISTLNRNAIYVSDRRQNECFKILQGSAVLNSRSNVVLEDFKSLIYVLWEKESDLETIEREILKMVNPYDDKFKEITAQFDQIKKDIESCSTEDLKLKKSIEAKTAIERLTTKLNKLINDAVKNGRDVTDFAEFKDKMVDFNNANMSKMLGTTLLGGLDDEQPAVTADGSGDDSLF